MESESPVVERTLGVQAEQDPLPGLPTNDTSSSEQWRGAATSVSPEIASPLSIDGILNRIAERQHVHTAMQEEAQRAVDSSRSATSPNRDLQFAQAVKDSDDPNTHASRRRPIRRTDSATPTRLTRLFAVHAPTSPPSSRTPSFTRPLTGRGKSATMDTLPLPVHLYTRGLLGGRHSDINIHVFGNVYALHRIILDRAPFFSSAFSEPWTEASSKDVTLHPEDTDPLITKTTFELALKRIYACHDEIEEQREAIGLLATGCWLEMQDLVEDSADHLLRTMSLRNLAPIVNVVTSNYYGAAGERIYDSAKVMLTRDGSDMPLQYWDGIPGEVIRDVVSSDGLYVKSEWERWTIARKILNRRLKSLGEETGLISAPDKPNLPAYAANLRTSPRLIPRRTSSLSSPKIESDKQWQDIYFNPEIQSLLKLLDEGIYYSHLEFEHLQHIRAARDYFGVPIIGEKTISDALWKNMELRQKVLNTPEDNVELGLKQELPASLEPLEREATSTGEEKKQTTLDEPSPDMESPDEKAPPAFLIPATDCNTFTGAYKDLRALSTSFGKSSFSNSATQQLKRTSFAGGKESDEATQLGATPVQSTTPACTSFPPFRFAAELPNHRLLKENKRSYSNVVFYAGSLWRFYVTKERTPSRSVQFGIYLQRARLADLEETMATAEKASVDERIGALEREMLLRRDHRTTRQNRRRTSETGPEALPGNRPPWMSTESGAQTIASDATTMVASQSDLLPATNLVMRSSRQRRSGNPSTLPTFYGAHAGSPPTSSNSSSASDSSDGPLSHPSHYPKPESRKPAPPRRNSSHGSSAAALPSYTDERPAIKAYFKIYSHSRDGKSASIYESTPEQFKFSQGWGWKSSGLMALVEDQRWSGGEGGDADMAVYPPPRTSSQHASVASGAAVGSGTSPAGNVAAADPASHSGSASADAMAAAARYEAEEKRRLKERRKREKLRFSIVLGVV